MRAQVPFTTLAPALLLAATPSSATPSYTLTSTNFNRSAFQVQPYVSNGYIGQRIPVEGHGFSEITPINATGEDGTQGWPLFTTRATQALVAGFFDQQATTNGTNFPQIGGEQPISTLPTWSTLYLTMGNASYGIDSPDSEITNWRQSMSIQDGVIKTALTWTPTGTATGLNLTFTTFAHRALPNLGVQRLDVEGLVPGVNVSFTDVLDGAGSARTDWITSGVLTNYSNTIFTAVAPNGISNVTAYETSLAVIYPLASAVAISSSCLATPPATNATISQCYTLAAPSSGSVSAIKYVGIASSDASPGTEFETALHASRHGNLTGFTAILDSHQAAWNAIWEESDIIIPDDDELQLVTRASYFHLLSNVREGKEGRGLGDNSIAPSGLGSDSYAGQIYWDADTWMFPPLMALYPTYAESITNFRHRQLGAAKENSMIYNSSGALYPWTAGRFGNCTGVGPCYNYEYHLQNDISLAQYQYYAATQNDTWLESSGWPVLSAIAEFWAAHVVLNETAGLYVALNETDPDEYANFRNNGAYTNAGVSVILKNAIELASKVNYSVPANWSIIAGNMTVLTDPTSNIILEYEGFNGTTLVKQADVVVSTAENPVAFGEKGTESYRPSQLLTYPLGYNQTTTQAQLDLDYYAVSTSPSGPGMTYSVFSIDASEVSTVGCAAYTYLLASSQPYSRAPFYQFSEETIDTYASNGGTNPAFTFLTGHGGFLQSLTHGFTGYRSRTSALYLDPILPPQLSNYTIKGLKWLDSTFSITLSTAQTIITHTNGSASARVEIGSSNSKAGNYTLAIGESLTIPTRSTNGTLVEGNLAQCQTSISNDTSFELTTANTVPGQYSLAAIDGSNSTTWQPLTNASTTMTVDLAVTKSIKALHFNWGTNPPISYIASAGTSLSNMSSISAANVNISAPYDAATANAVSIKVGNLTDVALSSPIRARFVNLTITGSFLADGAGGTVAEFAIL